MIKIYTQHGRCGSMIQVFAHTEDEARNIMRENNHADIYEETNEVDYCNIEVGFILRSYGDI